MSLTSEIDALSSQLTALVKKVEGKEDARKQLFGVAMGAASQLESSLDLCWRLIMSPHVCSHILEASLSCLITDNVIPQAPAALMTLLKMGVFDHLANAAGPISAQSLAKATEADSLLIGINAPAYSQGCIAELLLITLASKCAYYARSLHSVLLPSVMRSSTPQPTLSNCSQTRSSRAVTYSCKSSPYNKVYHPLTSCN